MTDRPIDPAAFAAPVREWLPKQRWYGAKAAHPPRTVEVRSHTVMHPGDPALHHLLFTVDGAYYQVFLGIRREPLPQRLQHAQVGVTDDLWLYDALYDSKLTPWLLDALQILPGAVVPTNLPSLVISAEQSNTSVVFGDQLVLKVFRRLSPGVNPDLEITSALAAEGCNRIPRPVAYFETVLDDEPTTGAILAEYLRTAVDGWHLARTSVRDLFAEADLHADEVGGDFAAESYRLGRATAEVHADLSRALPTDVVGADELDTWATQMRAQLDVAAREVPDLAPTVDALGSAFDALATIPASALPVPVQRIHGDLHLGQVLRTEFGWYLIDFEGEPARPLEERRRLKSPLRDVAGMLRSFDYAAQHMLIEVPASAQLEYRAEEWATRNQSAFCDGYADAMGSDPRDDGVLLRAFEADKIVYEVLYEAHNRPGWLPVPMAAARRLTSA